MIQMNVTFIDYISIALDLYNKEFILGKKYLYNFFTKDKF